MEKWKKSDFEIKGRFTGSRLAGRENEYVYEVFYNGKNMGGYMFSSKAKANEWLGKFLKKANDIREKAENMKKVKDDGGMPYENPKYNGKSYLEILYMAREMENDAIEVALALDQIAPEEDRKKFIEIANDENDHDKIYAEIIEREESKNNIFGNITNVFSVEEKQKDKLRKSKKT